MPSAGFEVEARDTLGLSAMLSIGSWGGHSLGAPKGSASRRFAYGSGR